MVLNQFKGVGVFVKSKQITTWTVSVKGEQLVLPLVRTRRQNSIAMKRRIDRVVLLIPAHWRCGRVKQVLQAHQVWLDRQADRIHQQHIAEDNPSFEFEHNAQFEWLGQSVSLQLSSNDASSSSEVKRFHLCSTVQQVKRVLSARQFELSSLYGFDQPQLPSMCHFYGGMAVESVSEGKQGEVHSYLFERCLIDAAERYFNSAVAHYAQQMAITHGAIEVKSYRSRWGSCHPDGRLQFNWRLMQAPKWVIDYVIVHELAHRIHANHSAAFWALVAEHYPLMNDAKRVLKQQGVRWIRFLT